MNALSPNLILGLIAIMLALSIYNLWETFSFRKMKKTFFAGQQAANLEDVILALKDQLKDSQGRQDILEQEIVQIKNNFTFAITRVGLIRFNPFQGSGGNFSFSLALRDSHNSGIIITSMYGREQNRIYTKKVDNGKCEIQLTEEELQAVTLANSNNLL
jgi:hypothetical protein